MTQKIPINTTKEWIFYIFGWLTGIMNITFWAIMGILYLIIDKKGNFFNNKFHRRVLIWGYVMGVITIIIISFAILAAIIAITFLLSAQV